MLLSCSMSAWKNSVDSALGAIAGMGFRHVDIIAIPGWGLVEPEALAKDFGKVAGGLEKLLTKHRLTPVGVNAAVPNIYQRDDQAVCASRLAQVDAICRLMKRLGIPGASFFPGGNWPAREMEWDEVLAGEVATLREMLALGAKYGVTLTLEPHANTPFQTLDQVRRLFDAVPDLRVAYDPSHFVMQDIPLAETAFILDRAAHVHVRDAASGKMQAPVGQGTVDFAWLVSELKRRKYTGAVSVEYLPGSEDQVGEMKRVLEPLMGG